MKWKNIILTGVFLAGLAVASVANAQSLLRNKPAGNTREQAMFNALDDTLNTDGTIATFSVVNGGTSTATITYSGVGSDTSLSLYNNTDKAVIRVTTGEPNSGGLGFRALVIPNE